jgi:PPOX class probable F420-dependent enzyme
MPTLDEAACRARLAGAGRLVLATHGPDGRIDLVPVTFAVVGDRVVHAVDHKPKSTRRLGRLRNIAADPHVALLADAYHDDWDRLWWVRAHGRAEVLDLVPGDLLAALVDRYDAYRERPPEGPFVVVAVDRWQGWSARPDPTIRPAGADDRPVLERMLALAVDWRPGTPVRPVADVLAEPSLAHYVTGWGSDRDAGVVAEAAGVPVGAAWWRYLGRDDPGYGFVDEAVPELSIGVTPEARGRGVGTLLLAALVDEARRRSVPGLSLSVEDENPAARLYRRLGFVPADHVDGSTTMHLRLDGLDPPRR